VTETHIFSGSIVYMKYLSITVVLFTIKISDKIDPIIAECFDKGVERFELFQMDFQKFYEFYE